MKFLTSAMLPYTPSSRVKVTSLAAFTTVAEIATTTNAKICHRRLEPSMVLLAKKEDREIALSADFGKKNIYIYINTKPW